MRHSKPSKASAMAVLLALLETVTGQLLQPPSLSHTHTPCCTTSHTLAKHTPYLTGYWLLQEHGGLCSFLQE